MAKDWGQIAGVVGGVATIIGLCFTAQQYYFGTFASTKVDVVDKVDVVNDVRGCNGFLIRENPVSHLFSKMALPVEVERKKLQDKILSCQDEIQKNAENDVKNAVAYTNIGEATRRLGDLPVALIAQQEALKLDPNLQEASWGLALVLADLGQTAEANQTIQDTLAQKPTAIAYFYQGVVFGNQKDWQSAETSFRKAIELDPNLAGAYINLGNALREQGKTAEAIAPLQKAISLNPDLAGAYTNLGIALADQGKTAEAIAAFQKAIRLNTKDADAYNNLGFSLYQQGKTAEAIAPLQKAISLNPNLAPAYINLGGALADQDKTAEAIANFKKGTDLYRAQGNTQKADELTQALKKLGIQ